MTGFGFEPRKANGVLYYTLPYFELMGTRVAFTTRIGGKSHGVYQELNTGRNTKDPPEVVDYNRQRVAHALGLDGLQWVAGRQVHGDRVAVVTRSDAVGGTARQPATVGAADGLTTREKGICLVGYFADCVPIFILDPEPGREVVGLAHGGWRGTVLHVARKTVAAMQRAFGTSPSGCLAAIGPSIGPCCYEVDERVVREVEGSFPNPGRLLRRCGPGKWKFNLWEANRQSLLEAGLAPEKVISAGLCTMCRTDLFYSHRAERGKTGRMMAVLTLL